MRGSRVLVAALVLAGTTYAAYPFVTLYRIQFALRGGDTPTLRSLVDWYSVREGIKEDICDLVLDEPGNIPNQARLPAFGASFVRGVTGRSVDREFTPEKIAKIAEVDASSPNDAFVSWAFFTSPAHFEVDVSVPGQAQPVRADLELAGIRWKVIRVWIPSTLLKQGHWTT